VIGQVLHVAAPRRIELMHQCMRAAVEVQRLDAETFA
jgi:hypothetical protein